MEQKQQTKSSGTLALIILTSIVVLAAMKACSSMIIPIVLAVFVYFLLGPLLDRLDKFHIPHILGIIICFLVMVLFLGFAIWVFSQTISLLIGTIPVYTSRVELLDASLTRWISKYADIPQGDSFLSQLPINWKDILVNGLTTASSQILSILKTAVLMMLYVLFMLLERQQFVPKLYTAFSGTSHGTMVAMLSQRISRQVSKYLLLKAVISLFTGVLFYLTAVVAGMDVPLMYGVLAFVFNFIPSIGSIIITVLTDVMCVIQFAPVWGPIIFVAIMTLSIEMILGNIIDPKLQGGQLNLSPVFILISLALWGYIWGIVGMFIAVPLTCCCEIICANIDALKPIAIILSGGKSFRRQGDQEKALRKKAKKNQKKGVSGDEAMAQAEKEQTERKQDADVILPDEFSTKKK